MPKPQDLILLVSSFSGTRLEILVASMARLHDVVLPIVELLNTANMQPVTSWMKQLDQEYNSTMFKRMEKLESYEKRMGDRYATALILPPILVSPEEREEILDHMRVGPCLFLTWEESLWILIGFIAVPVVLVEPGLYVVRLSHARAPVTRVIRCISSSPLHNGLHSFRARLSCYHGREVFGCFDGGTCTLQSRIWT